MAGYWQRPDETAKVMTADGYFRTGDIGVVDERGYFSIVDRKKDMILVSGFNVYPNEIEDVLTQMPGVLECAAVGIADAKAGEAVKVVIVKRDPALTEADVRAYCEANLTGYKRPKVVEFRNDLPKTPVGKVLRRELRDSHPRARPSGASPSAGHTGAIARSQIRGVRLVALVAWDTRPPWPRRASTSTGRWRRVPNSRSARRRAPCAGAAAAAGRRADVVRWQRRPVGRRGQRHVAARGARAHAALRCAWNASLARAVTLAVGMPANERMDALIEKATELGAARIQPLVCERSVLRVAGDRAVRKAAHWRAVAIAACEQCGRNRVPEVAEPLPLGPWLRTHEGHGAALWLLSTGDALPWPPAVRNAGEVIVLSGPEGGFTAAECGAAVAAGFVALLAGRARAARRHRAAGRAGLDRLADDLRPAGASAT